MSLEGSINRMIDSLTAVGKMSNTEETGITYGTIKSINPLSVLVDGHSVALPEEFFILGQNVRPHKVTIPHKHAYKGETYYGTNAQGQIVNPQHIHSIPLQVTEDLHTSSYSAAYTQDYVVLDIYPPLSAGDRVILLRTNNGQKYYILERIEAE